MANKKKMKRDFFVLLGLFIAAWIFLTVYDPDDEGSEDEIDEISEVQKVEPTKQQKDLKKELISTLRYKDIENDNSDIVKLLDEVENKISSSELDFELYLDNSSQVNLYSLPSDMIVITRGMLRTIDSPEQLYAIICHGLGHLKYNHNIDELESSLNIAVIHSEMGSAVDEARDVLDKNKYTNEMGIEAEKYAVDLMIELGINPSVLADYYTSLYKNIESVPELLGAHTGANDRIKILNDAQKSDKQLTHSFDWDEVKKKL